jgi:trehalose 6-phosphate synthase
MALSWRALTDASELSRIVGAAVSATAAAVASLVDELPRRPRAKSADDARGESSYEDANPWTAQRLKGTLRSSLRSERVIVVANRQPCIHERDADGSIVIRHPVSGLVTALEPVLRTCSGVWIGHGSGSADKEASDAKGRVTVQVEDASYQLRRIWLSPEEERGYYYGFANEALWPLCHLAHVQPTFRREDWDQYRRVNQRFADAVAAEADSDEPIVLVQDYHFALVPQLLRERFPRATILTFWHIPWPNPERFGICPYHDALLKGLLGSSILGFQTPTHSRNFVESIDRTLEARVDYEEMAIVHGKRRTLIRAYPISIEWPPRWKETAPSIEECRRSVRADLGLEPDTPLVMAADRVDYTKGIEERLLAMERVLEDCVRRGARLAFVQIAAPSRVLIDRYRQLGERVQVEVERINARFARNGVGPITLLHRHTEPPEVFRYYRAADVCYVGSLHDGMNLVAKEFVAARDDERGVLVLSRFAGAARELSEAILVNPYDIDGAAAALQAALKMSVKEQRERMRAMRAFVAEHNLYRWAGRMLMDAARLRERQQLRRRLGTARGTIQDAAMA